MRSAPGGPAATAADELPPASPPKTRTRPPFATAATRDVPPGSLPTASTRSACGEHRRGGRRRTTALGSRSSPSGLRYPGARTGDAQMTVLPHDATGAGVDDHDPVMPVVGHREQAVRPAHRERRPVERAGPGARAVGPDDPARRRDVVDPARRLEARDQDVPVREQLGVRRVRRRRADRVDEPARRASRRSTQPPISVTSRPPSGSGVSPFGEEAPAADRARSGRRSELAHDPPRVVDEQDAAVLDVRDHQLAVAQQVGVVGVREVARSGAGDAGVPVSPDDPVRAHVDQAPSR